MADPPELDATIERREAIGDWMATASKVIGEEVISSAARLLPDLRCALPGRDSTAACEEVAS